MSAAVTAAARLARPVDVPQASPADVPPLGPATALTRSRAVAPRTSTTPRTSLATVRLTSPVAVRRISLAAAGRTSPVAAGRISLVAAGRISLVAVGRTSLAARRTSLANPACLPVPIRHVAIMGLTVLEVLAACDQTGCISAGSMPCCTPTQGRRRGDLPRQSRISSIRTG